MSVLSLAQLKSLAQSVGVTGQNVNIAAAIAMAESGGDTNAYNPETAAGTAPGHGSRGLWQIYGAAHPQFDNAGMFDATQNAKAMYSVSNGGVNWNPWSTYTNGSYKKFLTSGGSVGGYDPGAFNLPKTGKSNGFPLGQCTWWADEHYHQLTGSYVPWNGNAYQWLAGAQANNWSTSATPPADIPSIMIMQPNVQGAGGLGHVAVVEKVNKNNTVTASNMNWASGPISEYVQGYPIRTTTINLGAGINFAWDATAVPGGSSGVDPTILKAWGALNLAPNADVTGFLVAIDQALTLVNPFDVPNVQQDTVGGVTFDDPVSWFAGFGSTIISDGHAITIRLLFLLFAFFLLRRVLENFVDVGAVMPDFSKIASQLGPILAA